ncbi:MAG TPA: hypothetical protein VLD37_06855 [Candidatus Bilamarchaeum sp.]|nr:hypothetical protein [Candidatus Bilamarchaeum sp.]
MSVTGNELRAYARPMLRRRTFRFHRLDGLVDERTHRVLELGKAFARASDGSAIFQLALRDAPEDLRARILGEFSQPAPKEELSRAEAFRRWQAMIKRVQGHIISEGVYTDFGRPASVGILLNQRKSAGLDLYYSLGESRTGSALLQGRIYHDPEGASILIYLWDAFARVGEHLDLLLSRRDLGEEGNFERTLYRSRREELESWCAQVSGSGWIAGQKPDFLIFSAAMRSVISGLRSLCESSESAREMLRAAINVQVDSLLSHELSHLAERNVNGSLAFGKESAEIIGYLLQASHGRADYAFLSMANRSFRFDLEMPELVEDVRAKGVLSLLEGEPYLKKWAQIALERKFRELTGRGPSELLDLSMIAAAQSSDHILPAHMPLVEKAMCNPSLQSG